MGYCEHPAPSALQRWVECAWTIDSASAAEHRVPPDGCVDLVYGRESGLRAVGTMTVEQRFRFRQGSSLTGVRFRPGMAAAFLGVAPSELTDKSIALEDLWALRAREIARKLDEAKTIFEAMRILISNLPRPEAPPNPVQRAIEAVTAARGRADLEDTANQANLSPRQFRRRCLEESGLTPKRLCRVLRFRHACDLAHASRRPDWPAIALEAEYFDQAHMIRDFQEFTGLTPMAVFSNT